MAGGFLSENRPIPSQPIRMKHTELKLHNEEPLSSSYANITNMEVMRAEQLEQLQSNYLWSIGLK